MLGPIAWFVDLIGFVIFIFTDTLNMWAVSLGLVVLSIMLAQIGMWQLEPDANRDGTITPAEAVDYITKFSSCASARRGGVVSLVIIGIWGATKFF